MHLLSLLFVFTAILKITTAISLGDPSPVSFPTLNKRACIDIGCRCDIGTSPGQYCGPGGLYDCHPHGGCCYYGPSSRCPGRVTRIINPLRTSTRNTPPKRSILVIPLGADSTPAIALPAATPPPLPGPSPDPAPLAAPTQVPRTAPGPAKKRRITNMRVKISPTQLAIEFDSWLASQRSAEIVVAHLVNKYNFDIKFLLNKISGQGLDVSFSRVTFVDIAPLAGLDPNGNLRDVTTFEVQRARIPTPWFKEIIGDMHLGINQFGPPEGHRNEEARSRFLAPLLGRIQSEFRFLIWNTPETIMPGRMSTRGRIEYQFKVCGALTILFIEVKLQIGSGDERLNAIAQLIAEADACDLLNENNGFRSTIYAVLCDGSSFEYFSFDGSTRPPVFSRGVTFLSDGTTASRISLPSYESTTRRDYIKALRPICESFYAMFLHGYLVGLQAYHDRSLRKAAEDGRERESTPAWFAALGFAEQAVSQAARAAVVAAEGDLDGADECATNAREVLNKSLGAAPPTYRREDCNLMAGWDDGYCK
ncbi:hypothetical protein Q9L58_008317 [Maublancomyces gigas]|uniref:Uncharacterized protein n=1 Tax=Discina gigas TaxID=1032678 RepID=A0ABR3GB52_9PEZI